MKKLGLILSLIFLIGLTSCKEDDETIFKDGTYYAELNEFSHGWKEFMEVTIVNENISTVNIDAMGEDGGLKSSLTEYPMPDPPGLPSTWYPLLEAQYLEVSLLDFAGVDGISGATGTSGNVDGLFRLILEAARAGDESIQIYTPPE